MLRQLLELPRVRRIDSSAGISALPPDSSISSEPLPRVRPVESQQLGLRIATGEIEVEAQGLRSLTEDIDAVRLSDDGWLILSEGDNRLEVRPSDDGLSYSYSVAGSASAFDVIGGRVSWRPRARLGREIAPPGSAR